MEYDFLLHVLIIEDNELDVLAIQSCFKKLNIPIFFSVCRNGLDAIELLEDLVILPHIIVLDMKMPKMNGVEFLKKLRMQKRFNDVSIFMVTGIYSTQDKLALKNLGILGRIVKPMSEYDALHMYMTAMKLPGFQTSAWDKK